MTYLNDVSTRRTPQSESIQGKDMVENRAGGFVFPVDDWTRLDRFLILGTEGGTYYASQREMTKENAEIVFRLVESDGLKVVNRIVDISSGGRAPRNTEALFTLAIATAAKDKLVRQAAVAAIPTVARTATHLFQLNQFRKQFAGRGRAFNRGVRNWYMDKPVDRLAYQMVKYRQRDGWSHADILRLVKPKPDRDSNRARLFAWAVGKAGPETELPRIVEGYERVQAAANAAEAAKLILDYKLPREAVPTNLQRDPVVQEALLQDIPITALIRNLGNMTSSGLLSPTSGATREVVEKIVNVELLRKGRVHPISVLIAMKTYQSGQGLRGRGSWEPIVQIVDALDEAFYATFEGVEPTGKRFLIGLDVSGSMGRHVMGIPTLSARAATSAMALLIAKTERQYECVAFTGGRHDRYYGFSRQQTPDMVTALPLSPRERLDDVIARTDGLPFGGTDCALPMIYAMEHEREVDAFLILTDNESWAGDIHASQALAEYRRRSGIAAKMVAMAVTATGYSVADPNDAGMLDVVGFDTAAPTIAADFIRD